MQSIQRSVRQRVQDLRDSAEHLRQLDREINQLVDEADLVQWDNDAGREGHFLNARLFLSDARNIESAFIADLFALTEEATEDSAGEFARSDLTAKAANWILKSEEDRWLRRKMEFAKALLETKLNRAPLGRLEDTAQAFLTARDELIRAWNIQRCRQKAAERPHAAVLSVSVSEPVDSPPVLFFFKSSDSHVYEELRGFLRVWGIRTKSYLDDETGGDIERWIYHEVPRAEKVVFLSSEQYVNNSNYQDLETRLAFEIEETQGGDIIFLLALDQHIPERLKNIRGTYEYRGEARSKDQTRRALLRAWGIPIPGNGLFSPRLYRPNQNGKRCVGVLLESNLDPDGVVATIRAHGIAVVKADSTMPDPNRYLNVDIVVSTVGEVRSSDLARHGWRGLRVLNYKRGALQTLVQELERIFSAPHARKQPFSG